MFVFEGLGIGSVWHLQAPGFEGFRCFWGALEGFETRRALRIEALAISIYLSMYVCMCTHALSIYVKVFSNSRGTPIQTPKYYTPY